MADKNFIKKALSKINLDYIRKKSQNISLNDVKKVVSNISVVYDKVKDKKEFKSVLDEIKLLGSMLKDYYNGNYREISFKTIAIIAFALIYILNPFDLVPDFIPGLGFVDDFTVLGLVLKNIYKDVHVYKDWKKTELE